MPTTTRTFRVFVSSTFEDLRDERNVLQSTVFPKLEKFCLEKSARFQAIDLRWGVREDAGLDQKTMEICLAEIARCQKTRIKPNFIVLLGKRYGWRPLPARIQQDEFETVLTHIVETGERDFAASWYDLDLNAVPPEYRLKPRKAVYIDLDKWKQVEKRIHDALREGAQTADLPPEALVKYEASATHQEILKGLGETVGDRAHVFAFFRESAADEDPDLTKLKDHLKAVLPEGNIFPYSIDDHARLCDDVERSLKMVIAATAAQFETLSEKVSHDRFAEDRARHFKGRETVLDAIKQYLLGDDRRPLVVAGPSGSGKSAIMAVASGGRKAIRRFIGATPESSNGITLLRNLCRELGERFGQTRDLPATFNELSAMFSDRVKLATAEQPVILFIDALDQLSAQDPAAAMRWLPSELPPYCRVVLSATEIPAAMRRAAMVPVEPLPVEDAGGALDSWFTEASRTLQLEQREKLLASFLRSGLPLYLKLAFEEARLWRSFDLSDKCVLGDGLPGIIDRLFARLSDPANHGRILVGHALGYLTAARYGLTEDEILAVLTKDDVVWKDVVGEGARRRHDPPLRQLPVIVWSRLHLDLEPYLTERTVPGGTTVSFYHRQLAERAETTPLHHNALAAHFGGQSYWLGSNIPNQRKLTELVQQQVGAGLPEDAAAVLTDLDFISAKCAAELVFDLEEDYSEASAALPEAQAELREEERRQAERARWTQTLIECAEKRRLPHPEEIFKSVELWSHDRIAAESNRITENPTGLDRLKAFAGFTERELYALHEFGKRPGFVVQQAFNSAPRGPVHLSAAERVKTVGVPILLRRLSLQDSYNPVPALLRTLEGHTGGVSSVSVTPDGRWAVSGSKDKTLRLWDLESGECLRTLEGHTGAVASVSVTPDGQFAVSGSVDETLRLWNLVTGQCMRTLECHRNVDAELESWTKNAVVAVRVTPDARQAVSGSNDRTLRVWNLHSGQCTQTLRGHGKGIKSISITPDARLAVSASPLASRPNDVFCSDAQKEFRLWDLDRGECLHIFQGHEERVWSVSITPDGKRVVSGSADKTVRVWEVEGGRCLRIIESPEDRIYGLDLSPDGRLAATVGQCSLPGLDMNWTLQVWDVETGTCRRTLVAHDDHIEEVSITADGRRAVTASWDGTLRLWDLEAGEGRNSSRSRGAAVSALGVSLDKRRAVSAGADGSLRFWDLESAQCRCTAKVEDYGGIEHLSVTPDGAYAVTGRLKTLRIWDMESGQCLETFGRYRGGINYLGIPPDGHRVISSDYDGLRVWDLNTKQCLLMLEGAGKCLKYSWRYSGGLHVWDIVTGLLTCVLETETEDHVDLREVSATQDGRGVVALAGNAVATWSLANGRRIRDIKMPELPSVLNLTPDGRRAVIANWDKTTWWVCDLFTGQIVSTLKGCGTLTHVSVMPDGNRGISVGSDNTIRVWNLQDGQCVAVAKGARWSRATILSCSRVLAWTSATEWAAFDLSDCSVSSAICTAWRRPRRFMVPTAFRVRCPWCGEEIGVSKEIGRVIGRKHGLTLEQSPCLYLPELSFHDPRLQGICFQCSGKIQFNPFLAEERHEPRWRKRRSPQETELSDPIALRQWAFESYDAGDYEFAEQLLRRALTKNVEVANNYCHLARILLMMDRDKEARLAVKRARRRRAVWEPYTGQRVEFLRVLLALLKGVRPDKELQSLRLELIRRDAVQEWDTTRLLDHLKPRLTAEGYELLQSLAAVINNEGAKELEHLETLPAWQQMLEGLPDLQSAEPEGSQMGVREHLAELSRAVTPALLVWPALAIASYFILSGSWSLRSALAGIYAAMLAYPVFCIGIWRFVTPGLARGLERILFGTVLVLVAPLIWVFHFAFGPVDRFWSAFWPQTAQHPILSVSRLPLSAVLIILLLGYNGTRLGAAGEPNTAYARRFKVWSVVALGAPILVPSFVPAFALDLLLASLFIRALVRRFRP